MKEKKPKYPVNPLAKTMSERTRLERYHQDKDKMFSQMVHASAEELREAHEKLLRWWDL